MFFSLVATTKIRNLYIIGTSHIAKQSEQYIEHLIRKKKPQAIALELDRGRYHTLLHPQTSTTSIAKISLLGGMLKSLQDRISRAAGTEAGIEMKAAIQLARQQKIPIYCIDQDVRITLKRTMRAMSWREKIRLCKNMFFMDKKSLQISLNLEKVPSKNLLTQVMQEFHQQYPGMYQVLVEERNQYMAKNLYNLMRRYKGTVLAVVGAGHQQGIAQRITWYLQKER